jgi:hypothetical protein
MTAVTDEDGRFELSDIPPGMYRLRAYLTGFLPSDFARVMVEEGAGRIGTILMSLSRLNSGLEEYGDGEGRALAELSWVVQHGKRNILKETEAEGLRIDPDARGETPEYDTVFGLSGEFGIRAATYEEGLEEFPGAGAGLDARLAYARLFIPGSGDDHWLVSAQLLESTLSSWAGRAEYASSDLGGGHRVATGVTYGNFLYGDLKSFRPPESVLDQGLGDRGSAEWFGSVYASDSFLLGPAAVLAGLSFQYFDYLDSPEYLSPSLEVSVPVGSGETTAVHGVVDHRVHAPGGEDLGLLSQVALGSVYGPSPARRDLRAETTERFGIGVEHRLSERTRVEVRCFQEKTTDQLLRTFLADSMNGSAGQFVVSNRGDFRTRGIGVALAQTLGPVEGSVGYTFGRIVGLTPVASEPPDSSPEIHDVTTTVGTAIDSTQTRLQAAYRMVYHPGLTPGPPGTTNGDALDSRFSLQVFQLLPFEGWNGTQWELMVAIRNLFYDDLEKASILDEISVIDAPRRVLGGVTVRF